MRMLHRIAASASIWGALGTMAWAQTPSETRPPAPRPAARLPAAPPPDAPQPVRRDAYRPTHFQQLPGAVGLPDYRNHPGNQSILRHYPAYSAPDYTYGFRNPGGVGRFEEYYPPGNVFQNGGRDPVQRAGFDQGLPTGTVAEQATAAQVGIQRYGVMQQHIDNFARPLGFYGYGGFGFGPY